MNGPKQIARGDAFYHSLEGRCRTALARRAQYEEARTAIHHDVLATVREVERVRLGHTPEIIRYDIYGSTAEVEATWYSPSLDRNGRVRFPLELVYNPKKFAEWKEAVLALDSPDWAPEVENE